MSALSSMSCRRASILLACSFLVSCFFRIPSSVYIYAADSDTIVYVDGDALGANNGTSWQDAYTDLRSALNDAQEHDTFWVAEGIYYTFPTIPSNLTAARTYSFHIPNGVEVYGGFTGNETRFDQRDWKTHLTILSGDLERNDTTVAGVITDSNQIAGTNTRNVVFTSNSADHTTVLDGLIVTGGKTIASDSLFYRTGGGMLNVDASPTIRNVSFMGNYAEGSGGGMSNYNNSSSQGSNAILINVVFTNNTARYAGGGLYNWVSSPSLTDVTFTNNRSIQFDGGGMYTANTPSGMYQLKGIPQLNRVNFTGNTALYNGGGFVQEGGAAQLTNVHFTQNSAEAGGGLMSSSNIHLTSTSFISNTAKLGGGMAVWNNTPILTDTLFSGNRAVSQGGGLFSENSHARLTKVAFIDNHAEDNGAGMFNKTSNPTLTDGRFIKNNSEDDAGAIYNEQSNPTLKNVAFTGNSAYYRGGAIYNEESDPIITDASFTDNSVYFYGGAIANEESNPTLTNVSFVGNQAEISGGAMYNGYSSPVLSNSVFAGNSADYGGGMENHISSPTLINTTFSGNAADIGGAILNDSNSNPSIANSILWNNTSSLSNDSSTPTISYSLVEGCYTQGVWDIACGTNNGNNISDTDPRFAHPIDYTHAPTSTGDFHLQRHSPAIDAGNTSLSPSNVPDLDGKPRIIGSSIDLGAYEYGAQLTTTVLGNGMITYTPHADWYGLNTAISLTATANLGWSFAGWSGDVSGPLENESLLITETKAVTATFTNDAPIADAGSDQSVVVASTVALDGSGSFDRDPTQTLQYLWTQTTGPSVILNDAYAMQPHFSAPMEPTTLNFSLIVTDSLGVESLGDSVTITTTNTSPIANAGADQLVEVAALVTLDGSGSGDPENHLPLRYRWTQTAGLPVSLSDLNAAQPSFTAPLLPSALHFSLIVTDSLGTTSATDEVTITVFDPIQRVYLPHITQQADAPNLVVTALQGDQNGISLIIKNNGTAATTNAFWVDVFINPHQPPMPNTLWHEIAPAGAVWGINRSLAPGESLMLTQASPFYGPEYSAGTFEAGAVLYAMVDSYHSTNARGAQAESDENDNRYGPVAALAAGSTNQPSTPSDQSIDTQHLQSSKLPLR